MKVIKMGSLEAAREELEQLLDRSEEKDQAMRQFALNIQKFVWDEAQSVGLTWNDMTAAAVLLAAGFVIAPYKHDRKLVDDELTDFFDTIRKLMHEQLDIYMAQTQ